MHVCLYIVCCRNNSPYTLRAIKQTQIYYSGALAREARSGTPWVRKCGKLPIQENLVIT